MININYKDNVLEVYKDDVLIISQPFRPTETGEQISWIDEADALAWWDTIKDNFNEEV